MLTEAAAMLSCRPHFSLLIILSGLFVPEITNNLVLAQEQGGCTTNSFATPSWLIDNFQYPNASLSSTGPATATYRVLNRATNVSVELTCPSSNKTIDLGPGLEQSYGWRTCLARNETQAGAAMQGYLQLNRTAAQFLINETWSCYDMTPNKPCVLFKFCILNTEYYC
jgi:hypothetical protein